MLPNQLFEQFINQVNQTIGPGSEELKQQLKAALSSAFSKMDLVTREEFEAQKAVLMRTRSRLEELEKTVAELEQTLKEE